MMSFFVKLNYGQVRVPMPGRRGRGREWGGGGERRLGLWMIGRWDVKI